MTTEARSVLDTARDTKPSRKRPKPSGKPLSVRLADAPAIVGVSLRGLAGMIQRGELKATRRGRCVLIPYSELERLAGAA